MQDAYVKFGIFEQTLWISPLLPHSFFKFFHIFAHIFVQKYHLPQFYEIGH